MRGTKFLSEDGLRNGNRDRPAGTPTERDLPVPDLLLAEYWHAMTGSVRMVQKSMLSPALLIPLPRSTISTPLQSGL
jgi:hypothetical protein